MMVPYENPQKLLGKYGQQIAEWKAADEYDCSHQGLFALKRGGNQVYVANDTRCAHVCDRLTHSLLAHRGLFAEEFVCLVLLRKQARTDICNGSVARDIIPAIQGCPLGESSVVLCTGETLGYRPASWSTSNPGKLGRYLKYVLGLAYSAGIETDEVVVVADLQFRGQTTDCGELTGELLVHVGHHRTLRYLLPLHHLRPR